MRIRSTPLQPCRRHGKKRPGKEGEEETPTATQPAAAATTKKESNSKSSKTSKSTTAKSETNTSGQTNSNSKSPGASQSPRSQTPSTTSTAQNNANQSAFAAPNSQCPTGNSPENGILGAAGSGGNANGGGGLVNPNSNLVNMASMINTFTEAQLQSNQISSTVLDSPYTYDYNTGSYVDSRHNYYNHPAAAAAAVAVHHTHPHHSQAPALAQQPMPTAPQHPQWPDYNNNGNHTGAPSTAYDATGQKQHRVGIEENPDSTSLNNIHNAYNSGFAAASGAPEAAKIPPPEVDYYKPKTEYQTQSHHHATNQGSYSMYPPPPPPPHHPHHPHHHHPGFGEHQAYQQNYDYRYNYSPYANQAFHHPYSGMYSPSAYSGAHGWNAMYSAAPTTNHSVTSAVLPATPHIPVSVGNSSGLPFGYANQMLPLSSSPAAPAAVIKSEPVPKVEPIGEVQEVNDNVEAFQDAQMGGIGIALGHGSVLFECAKHEMHATTALKKPNRTLPNRIALIFYQHRNLNRPKHGTEEWEEKMRLKKTNQEVENKLLKSIKQEGAPEAGHSGTAATVVAGGSSSKKGSKGSKTEQNVTTAAPETDIKLGATSAMQSSPQPPTIAQLPPAPLSVGPTWPSNFAMGYPMSSPYHQHPHANPQFHHHHQYQSAAAHHHMMGPIAKTSHIGSPTKSLST